MSEPVDWEKFFDPQGPDPAASPPDAGRRDTPIITAMRLAAGGSAMAMDAIRSAAAAGRSTTSPGGAAGEGAAGTPVPAPINPSPRHLLVGAAFEAGDRVQDAVIGTLSWAWRAVSPPARWAGRSWPAAPARGAYRRLAGRAATRLERWQARGLLEEQQGRELLDELLERGMDATLDQVVASPQVHGLVDELVAAESMALSQRLALELRSRTVNADLYGAHLVRSVLRHPVPEVPPLPRRMAATGTEEGLPTSLQGRSAGFVTRLAAFITDIIIISILIRFASWFLEGVRLATGIRVYLPQLTGMANVAVPIGLTALGGLLISVGYVLFFWTLGGQTPGKALLGLRVVRRDGGRISFWRSLVRFFGYWLSSLLFGAGFWWAAVDNHREALQDKLAGTSVVYAWKARPSEEFLTGRWARPEGPN